MSNFGDGDSSFEDMEVDADVSDDEGADDDSETEPDVESDADAGFLSEPNELNKLYAR